MERDGDGLLGVLHLGAAAADTQFAVLERVHHALDGFFLLLRLPASHGRNSITRLLMRVTSGPQGGFDLPTQSKDLGALGGRGSFAPITFSRPKAAEACYVQTKRVSIAAQDSLREIGSGPVLLDLEVRGEAQPLY